jgi:hypothetical protein
LLQLIEIEILIGADRKLRGIIYKDGEFHKLDSCIITHANIETEGTGARNLIVYIIK